MSHISHQLKRHIDKQRPIIIGVAGGSCSGKTTVSRLIFHNLMDKSLMIIHEDSYYKDQSDKTPEERKKTNYDHPLAFDNDLLLHQLKELIHHHAVDEPIYDYKSHNRSKKTKHQEPKDVIILEGILTLYDKRIRDLMDIKVYVDADDDIRLIRRLKRDVKERDRSLDSIIQQYLETVRPMFHQFIEPTKRYADVIIPEGGHNHVAIDLLTTKIRSVLHKIRNYRKDNQ
ncbi:uridine kinase [Acetilactobacillus jinshanensis]|uniref:Uridine kinase n=1 Tax=Acetilactobacillus jinshanensis TaxID=1720083 RepID=A0A4P6ZKW6_9LACO|nr:uridine kinase [Acetilactobacillus jinshanensis]